MALRNPIRVLHVGKFYAPVEGGIENVVQEFVSSFSDDQEISSSVLVAQKKGPGSVDLVNGTSVRRVRSHGVLLGTPCAPRFPKEIASRARNFDIVHVHVPNPLPFFCDWRTLRRQGVRLVIHHHSDIVRPVQRGLLRCMASQERRFYSMAQRILVSSNRLLSHSETLSPYRQKCRVLPLSISLEEHRRISPQRMQQVRAELGYTSADTVFFFLGRLVYYKGVQDLLKAAALSGSKVLIGGGGPLRQKLEALTRQLGIAAQVTFLGKIDQARLPEIFEASDVFVLPSNAASEAFGVVQLEAMAHGLPVINTALLTGVPEVSLHQVSGLTVPPGGVAELAEAMRLLAGSAELRALYAAGAIKRVQAFARPSITENLRMLYREVMNLPIEQRDAASGLTRMSLSGLGGLRHASEGDIQPCSTKSLSSFPRQSSSV